MIRLLSIALPTRSLVRTLVVVAVWTAPIGAQASSPAQRPQSLARPDTVAALGVQATAPTRPAPTVAPTDSQHSPPAVTAVARARPGLGRDTLRVQLLKSEGRDWTPVIIALVSIATSGLVATVSARQKNRELGQTLTLKNRELDQTVLLKQQELDRALDLKVREQERAELTRRLTAFYGPLKQHLDLAFVLYKRLCEGDPQHRTRGEFRTLVSLLNGEHFSDNDRAIIDELVATTASVRELIMSAEGMVEDEDLLRVLSAAAAHFRLLELAATGKIKGEVARFESSTYPRELDGLVEGEISRVRTRIQVLTHV